MDTKSLLLIREEQSQDGERIRIVNQAAFGRGDEADLVDRLRTAGAVLVSLVAEVDSRIVGHVSLAGLQWKQSKGRVAAVSLAPMAVLPDHQRRQIGSQLVRRGLIELGSRGERIVIVWDTKNTILDSASR